MATLRQKPGTIVLLALALAASGCTQWADPSLPETTVFPVSDSGGYIQDLYSLIFWMALVVFIGVEGFFLYAIVRYRRRAGDNRIPAQVHGNLRLEIAWTVLPSIVLLVITVPTIKTIFLQDTVPTASAAGGSPLTVEVTGHQWFWEFRYPELGAKVMTANEVHIPVGRTALFELRSADVIHSFWIPKMGGKMDAVPTRVNFMWFTPQETGEFYGQCVEFCGIQHADMRIRLFVDSPSAFQAWATRQAEDAASPTGAQARDGAAIFQRSACPACHTIRGTAARGTTGPDLTHVGGRATIAAGMLPNNYENLIRWVSDPQGVKIGSKMRYPNDVGPSPTEAALLAAYLQSLQ